MYQTPGAAEAEAEAPVVYKAPLVDQPPHAAAGLPLEGAAGAGPDGAGSHSRYYGGLGFTKPPPRPHYPALGYTGPPAYPSYPAAYPAYPSLSPLPATATWGAAYPPPPPGQPYMTDQLYTTYQYIVPVPSGAYISPVFASGNGVPIVPGEEDGCSYSSSESSAPDYEGQYPYLVGQPRSATVRSEAPVVGEPVPVAPQPVVEAAPDNLSEEDDTFFVGFLLVSVHCAENLPNTDARCCGRPSANCFGKCRGRCDKTDAYVRVLVDNVKGPRTHTIKNSLSPTWEEMLSVPLVGEVKSVQLAIKDENHGRNGTVGVVPLEFRKYLHEDTSKIWLPVQSDAGGQGRLCISTKYLKNSAVQTPEVRGMHFPARPGGRLTMYADAHCDPAAPVAGMPPELGGFEARDCWADMYKAMAEAKRFIYITGWSLWVDLRLIRSAAGGTPCLTLGQLLKQKASEGLCVRIMLWDDPTALSHPSAALCSEKTVDGMFGTHAVATCKFFKKSAVVCVRVRNKALGFRSAGGHQMGNVRAGTTAEAHLARNATFSHHQKTVCCDAEGLGAMKNKRRVIAFLGGLDLTDGRYDDATHPLFSTLRSTHAGDFYQKCATGLLPEYGPRQPWHDVHCCVEGPVAHDVLKNFEDRWAKQVARKPAMRFSGHKHLLQMQADFGLLQQTEDVVPGGWTLQLFRSINKHSAAGVADQEDGCQAAYVLAIRRAKRFVYLESQYFMGSATQWDGYDEKTSNVECKNHVPYELAMRIVTHIRQKKPFKVYLVLPLYPEGDAASAAVQGMLYWQALTIQMMYRKVADALKRWDPKGAVPTDYLNVFFLGNRELPTAAASTATPPANLRPKQATLLATRRHQIYVHSKMGVFDDDYVLIGSANINQRSLDGARDTEILVGGTEAGALPPGPGQPPRGSIAAFRLRLWAEHLGAVDPAFWEPQTAECVSLVQRMAADNWQAYMDPTPRPLPHGHLCRYPYDVNSDGRLQATVAALPDQDPKATVLGGMPPRVLHILTT